LLEDLHALAAHVRKLRLRIFIMKRLSNIWIALFNSIQVVVWNSAAGKSFLRLIQPFFFMPPTWVLSRYAPRDRGLRRVHRDGGIYTWGSVATLIRGESKINHFDALGNKRFKAAVAGT
jgi:hypothetical protein